MLSSLTWEELGGQARKMSVLILRDKDHVNIDRSFLKHQIGFPDPLVGSANVDGAGEEEEGAL